MPEKKSTTCVQPSPVARVCRGSWASKHLYVNEHGTYPKDPCTQIVYTLALKYLYRDYIKAKVYTIWVHGPLGLMTRVINTVTRLTSTHDPSEGTYKLTH